MYEPWLSAPPNSSNQASPASFGHRLRHADPSTCRVALIGGDATVANAARECLYAHYWDHGNLPVADLGNLRKTTVEFAIPLLRELHQAGMLPVILGADVRLARAQYLAFAELNREIGIGVVDATVRLQPEEPQQDSARQVLDAAIHRAAAPVFHLAHFGDQRHLSDPALDPLFTSRHYERFSLGQSRGALPDLEPALRDCDLAWMHLSAVVAADIPAQSGQHPSGLLLQEACQLAYYAGNSDRLSSFGLYGYAAGQASAPERQRSEQAQAQLVWYFLHGVCRRQGDFPASDTGLIEYVVDSKLAERFTFWRSPRTERWWIEVPGRSSTGEARNRLVSCSYGDYLAVSEAGKLPERLFRAFSRY